MREHDLHLSDEQLVRCADGELHGREQKRVRTHLAACWSCRLRLQELENAVADYARLHRGHPAGLPSAAGPRALLRARLRDSAATNPRSRPFWTRAIGIAAGILALLVVWQLSTGPAERAAMPRSDLTPGAVRRVAASEVCAAQLGDNSEVAASVQRLVFAEYGMNELEAARYEVDYLITPALGGSDDIRNLWPQPYDGSPWNAYVKDALEARLRGMVCAGQLDLATAQREIARDWVAAYKKYFRTARPLAVHTR